MSRLHVICFFAYTVAIAFACYRRPQLNDFDRYIYEAIVRQKYEPWEKVNADLRHSYSRLQESTVADSPEHIAQLEPFYAVKPLYLALIGFLNQYFRLPAQSAIGLISVTSMLITGGILLFWTRQPLLSALIVSTQSMTTLGRLGTPDALSTLLVVGGCCAMMRKFTTIAILLFLVSIYVRTDNVIVVLMMLVWMTVMQKSLKAFHAIVLACIAVGSVFFINHFSGNYGWAVLFRFSFLPKSTVPSDIPSHVSVSDYTHIMASALTQIPTSFAPWAILGLVAWRRGNPTYRSLLAMIAIALPVHFFLFPSPQDRYYVWGYVLIAAIFVKSLTQPAQISKFETGTS